MGAVGIGGIGVGTERVNLNIPVAHFQNILSWDKSAIDRLVNKAIEAAVKVGPYQQCRDFCLAHDTIMSHTS